MSQDKVIGYINDDGIWCFRATETNDGDWVIEVHEKEKCTSFELYTFYCYDGELEYRRKLEITTDSFSKAYSYAVK